MVYLRYADHSGSNQISLPLELIYKSVNQNSIYIYMKIALNYMYVTKNLHTGIENVNPV